MIAAKSRTCLLIALILTGLSTGLLAQIADVEPKIITLERRQTIDGSDNYINAAFSFKFGLNGEEGRRLTRNNWDVLFGNSPTPDSFDVTMVVDDRSRIIDLGSYRWTDRLVLPALPAYEKPTRDPSVPAIVGHMYLVHSCDRDTDHFAVFRVEDLESNKNVTISWILLSDDRSGKTK